MEQNACSCMHHKMVPIFIIIIGLLFLLSALKVVGDSLTAVLWPIALILIGLQKMMGGSCKCCPK